MTMKTGTSRCKSTVWLLVPLVAAGMAFGKDGERRLSLEEFRDKMQGAWVGQMAGVAWGQPTEFKFVDRIMPAEAVPTWEANFHDLYSYGNDDLFMEMTFLKTLEDYGLDVSSRQAGIDFANTEYSLWCANLQGRTNLRKGIAPPDSSHPHYTDFGNAIDYQIEADYSGIIAPGLPQEAIRLGNVFGRLMNWGDGVWAGEFIGALYAEAYFTDDVDRLLDAGLKAIPAECDYAQMVRNVRAWHRESPGCWSNAWQKICTNYNKKALRDSIGGADVRLNGACIVLGLLYGGGDFEKSVEISMRCGWDSDCNPSNVGGILGCAHGLKGIPEKFKSTVNLHAKFLGSDYDLAEVYRVSEKLARDVVARYGGRVERDESGRETFVVPVSEPVPDAYLPTWNAGPVAGTKYSPEEMKKIRFAAKLPVASELYDKDPTRHVQNALDALYPGWKAMPCGRDRQPGYVEALHFPRGVIDYGYVRTHPTKYRGTEPTGFVRDVACVPEGDPRLEVTVAVVKNRPIRVALRVNGETAREETVTWSEKDETGSRKLTFLLDRWAGKPAKLELLHLPGGTVDESVCWGHLELKSNNGSF